MGSLPEWEGVKLGLGSRFGCPPAWTLFRVHAGHPLPSPPEENGQEKVSQTLSAPTLMVSRGRSVNVSHDRKL